MRRRTHPLPPLNALRAFEATARHLSVKDAAEELCVTPGAVSQLLKTLELYYGVRLFSRGNRSIALTDTGQGLLPSIRTAFRIITDASEKLVSSVDSGVLTVSVTPFFAAAWLIPRMHLFRERCPDIDLRVVTENVLTDFSRKGIDVAVRHGLGNYPGLQSDHVAAVDVVPVASRELVARLGQPNKTADLLQWPQVHDAERKGWHRWFQAQGISDTGPLRGPSFDDPNLRIKAVLAGEGAALLPAGMVALEVADGRLVRLAKEFLLEDFAYYLVYPDRAVDRASVAAFRAWILDPRTKDFGNRSDQKITASRRGESPPVSRGRRRVGQRHPSSGKRTKAR